MSTVKLKYMSSYVDVDIPDKNLYAVLNPEDLPGVIDPFREVREALDKPIESIPLKEMAKSKKNVVILASDITRPSPSHILVPPIVEELKEAGVEYSDITVVFGLGYHRQHTEEEKKKLVGEEVYSKVRCIDHDINDCVYLGTTKRGTPVEVFRPVAESDLLIATGNLEFHYKAGYSGGDKALLPGVCSKKTIETNHVMMIRPGTMPGRAQGNPMREDIEEAGRIAGVDFIVNAVLNSHKEIVKVVAGDPVKAHREGAKYIDKMYKRNIEEKVDVVVASCGGFPKDINLYQAQKGLENASYAVRDGGSIILLAECREGLGEATFEDWMMRAKTPHDCVEWIQQEFKLGAHKAAVICMVLERAKVYLVSGLDENLVRDIFFIPAKSVQQALDKALKEYGEKAKVLVLPYANSTLPYVE
ncbi:nickel-dependent lactate racemase [Biomaibacter acetigenes]|jgi:nickel-dependent lactate racemase|uniref:Nickel-dependent lactate racemase n=1 Tax=Biomaibacter acetigenes TaxID=2316383 RepID=A0A3G2R2S6_9FIRM|nr:nickel-dependent lactate racemase [Biomaibacter acetigenes]AYO29672.1 nickel-dependent lactate racemase [Biomaibacter acetigenes]